MRDDTTKQSTPAKPSLANEMSLGAFWCVAGMFFVGPWASVAYRLLNGRVPRESLGDLLMSGLEATFYMMLLLGGFIILAPVGACVGGVVFWKFQNAPAISRWRTISAAVLTDAVIAFALAGLALFIRS